MQRRFPEAVTETCDSSAAIYFVDEAAVRIVARHGARSAKRQSLRTAAGVLVSPCGLMRFSFIADCVPSKRFIDFLRKLHCDAGRAILVIIDNAAHRHSGETQRFFGEQGGRIQLLALPAYAPKGP